MGTGLSTKKKKFSMTYVKLNGEVNFDDFQILRAIGKGSFGKVCIVQKNDSQKMYAMKYMNKLQCFKKDAFKNVLKEIEILSSLDHPFLVNLWFTFQDEEDMFMVVDLLVGGDLRYHLQQGRVFDVDRVSLYLCEVALALDYLRSKRILHRDIKPDNILLDDAGHVHITDFNIATVLEEGEESKSFTGTKPYMAPEVFECALDHKCGYSFPADWWSLGVSVYEMICGHRPYDIHATTSPEEAFSLLKSTCLRLPREIPKNTSDLVKQLLYVDPTKRISSIDQIRRHPSMTGVDFRSVLNMQITPSFVPNKNRLNCDPTFELEEMIIEAKPLHKKKKRLSKKNSTRVRNNSINEQETEALQKCMKSIEEEFTIYNREKEMYKKSMAEKEQQWEKELQKVVS